MQILPNPSHFNSVLELKKSILLYYNYFKLPYERNDINNSFFNPEENTFEVLLGKDSEKILIPDSTQYPFLYRGQQKDIEPCLPTLFRDSPTDIQIFIERLRQVEFALLVEQHPVVKIFFKKNNFKIDYIGLAQHYGLKTHLLDLTNDIDIAFFFAMCQYNRARDCYEPNKFEGLKKAVLYVIVPTLIISSENDTFLEDKISVIGMQPFLRPAIQRGFSFSLKRNERLESFKYSFNYTKEDSEYYYEKFKKGDKLWIKDLLADKAGIISTKGKFSVTTFNKTWDYYPIKNVSKNKLKKSLLDLKISISTHNKISSYTENEIKDIIQKWNNNQVDTFIYQIRRKSWNEIDENKKAGKKQEFRTLEMLAQTELLRLVGNRSGIEQYIKNARDDKIEYPYRKNDTGWKKIPGRFELAKSEIFLKRKECLIE
jgi:hypothetical protein